MAGRRITPDQKAEFFALYQRGYSIAHACEIAGFSEDTAKRLMDRDATRREERAQLSFGDPIPYEKLSDEAKRAWNDFAYFQRRYFGRVPIPWQVEAAETVVEALETDREEWIVLNCPPGSGKTTCFTHDIPAWITVRNRAITGLLGSAVQTTAESYVRRLRNTFERTIAQKADVRHIQLGLAADAESTLGRDFGRFRPAEGVWAASQLVVAQLGGVAVGEKEATWTAFGRDGGVLGFRYQFVNWDDLVTPKRLRNAPTIEDDQQWYVDVAEARLEPGGTFLLQGQRFGPSDLYRFALDMREIPEGDEDDEDDEQQGTIPKYRHICYRAHYEELCQGLHSRKAPAYGEGGCLLSPRRLSWRKLSTAMLNSAERYEVVYQQKDVDPATVLVHKDWVSGENGHVGCWDSDRDRLELPPGIDKNRLLSVVTVDPSPSKYWAIEWWLVDVETHARYLLSLDRTAMGANKFLDYIVAEKVYVGLAEEMMQASITLGVPITHFILETNAAQKFMTQYDMVKTWQRHWGVQITRQDTYANKSDPDYGVQTMGSIWQQGLVRLPGKNGGRGNPLRGRIDAMKLVDEVTKWPQSSTDDCVMAEWFLEWHLPELIKWRSRQGKERAAQVAPPAWLAAEAERSSRIAGVARSKPRELSGARRLLAMASGMLEAS